MKKLVLFIIACLFSFGVFAEVTKLRTNYIAYQYKNEYSGYWNEWGDWQDCNVLIVIDFDRDRITIYSQKTQEYDVISVEKEDEDYESKSIYFDCVDEEGLRCTVQYRGYNDRSRGDQLYVTYNDVRWVYSIPSNY